MKKVILLAALFFGMLGVNQVSADIAPKYSNWQPCSADYQCVSNWCGCSGGSTMQCLPNQSYTKTCTDENYIASDVHRFWSPVFKSHFYTISTSEYIQVKNYDSNWVYEGVAFKAYTGKPVGTIPVYRFWSPVFHSHFYTTDEAEYNRLKNTDPNWTFEKIDFYTYSASQSGSYNDVHRFWSPSFGSHFYTSDFLESERVKNDPNWKYEGVAFRVVK